MNFGPGQGNLNTLLNLNIVKNAIETTEPKDDPVTAGTILAARGRTATETPLCNAMKLSLESEKHTLF